MIDPHDIFMLAEKLGSGAGATMSEIRDLMGTTRKFAVPICEYLDQVGVTRRDGDLRFLAASEEKSAAQGEPSE